MADTIKVLTADGVKVLYDLLSLQDYPNNDVLMAVINAIDETKADRSELVQSDWNEINETSLAYIQNKTHYSIKNISTIVENLTFQSSDSNDDYRQIAYGDYPVLIAGQKYSIIFDGVEYEAIAEDFGSNWVCIGKPWGTDYSIYPFCIQTDSTDEPGKVGIQVYVEVIGEHTISISSVNETIVALDEKYIPDTIARVSDIPDISNLATAETVSSHIENTTLHLTEEERAIWNAKMNGDKIFVGTKAEYNVANIAGEIPVGALVILTDVD